MALVSLAGERGLVVRYIAWLDGKWRPAGALHAPEARGRVSPSTQA